MITEGKITGALNVIHLIRRDFLPEVDMFSACLTDRLLPTFADVEQEADRVDADEYRRLCEHAAEDSDTATLTEQARDVAISYGQLMKDIEQGVTNMFSAGLYHLLEQHLFMIYRQELLGRDERDEESMLSVDKLHARFAAGGIYIKSFPSWGRIDDLRELANVVKHAEGRACVQLRQRRPDLFLGRTVIEIPELGVTIAGQDGRRPVYQPILGDGIRVTAEAFQGFVGDVRNFWNEMMAALRAVQP